MKYFFHRHLDGYTATMNYDECIASHTTENLIRESSSCSFIQMPKPLKGRGRAKGFGATTIKF
ncbi:hypothetical protein X975_25360, partial [Stegodyphus mimosarum]